MSVGAILYDTVESARHVVQLYGDDTKRLIDSVAHYLGEGLRRGDGLLVIATAERSHAITRQLADDAAYQPAVQQGRLAVFDAEILLSQVLTDGRPNRIRFEHMLGQALRLVGARSSSGRIKAYDEMVGLLWAAHQTTAAIRLEEYWNQLLARHRFELFCAYPVDVLADQPQTRARALHGVLCTHTHLHTTDGEVERVLQRALDEVLGGSGPEVRALVQAAAPQPWAGAPTAEAIVCWLKAHRPADASRVLDLAKRYRREAA
jgi:hypothetical protein